MAAVAAAGGSVRSHTGRDKTAESDHGRISVSMEMVAQTHTGPQHLLELQPASVSGSEVASKPPWSSYKRRAQC